jgi:aspartyl-tRNA(Asn)/glutamyl-tRNA(Gln) amidotransferase subunit A
MTELHDLTATEALVRMRARTLSPVDYLESLLARIDAREPTIQAWVCMDRDVARRSAENAAKAYASGTAGPLSGIPIGIKDLILTEHLPTAGNFVPMREFNPGYDATCIERLRKAGAIILGKVETTQFAGRDITRTHNPWDLTRTASGSSSGSAVAVADRMVPITLGTQTGGSVIRPAGYMGVVGFTPTFGRISRFGLIPRSYSFDMIGVMGRSVADAALSAAAMTGPDQRDRATLKRTPFKLPDQGSEQPPRLLLFEDFFDISSDDINRHVILAVERLEAAGAKIRRARLPVPLDLMISLHTVILITEASSTQASNLLNHRKSFASGLLSQLDIGSAIPATAYIHTQRLRHRIRHQFETLLKGFDGFILPSTSEVAPDRSTIGPRLCQTPWTILGWPVFTVPAGLGDEGLPIGVQLVGAPFKESNLINVADWVERHLDPMPVPGTF